MHGPRSSETSWMIQIQVRLPRPVLLGGWPGLRLEGVRCSGGPPLNSSRGDAVLPALPASECRTIATHDLVEVFCLPSSKPSPRANERHAFRPASKQVGPSPAHVLHNGLAIIFGPTIDGWQALFQKIFKRPNRPLAITVARFQPHTAAGYQNANRGPARIY